MAHYSPVDHVRGDLQASDRFLFILRELSCSLDESVWFGGVHVVDRYPISGYLPLRPIMATRVSNCLRLGGILRDSHTLFREAWSF